MITLIPTTNQEAFNSVVAQLTVQVRRAYAAMNISPSGQCLYRAPEAEVGNDRCAIGGMIRDEEYDPHIEGAGIVGLLRDKRIVSTVNDDLLYELQRTHDQSDHWNESGLNETGWADLRRLADRYHLAWPS